MLLIEESNKGDGEANLPHIIFLEKKISFYENHIGIKFDCYFCKHNKLVINDDNENIPANNFRCKNCLKDIISIYDWSINNISFIVLIECVKADFRYDSCFEINCEYKDIKIYYEEPNMEAIGSDVFRVIKDIDTNFDIKNYKKLSELCVDLDRYLKLNCFY